RKITYLNKSPDAIPVRLVLGVRERHHTDHKDPAAYNDTDDRARITRVKSECTNLLLYLSDGTSHFCSLESANSPSLAKLLAGVRLSNFRQANISSRVNCFFNHE